MRDQCGIKQGFDMKYRAYKLGGFNPNTRYIILNFP